MLEISEIIQEKVAEHGRERKALLPILQSIVNLKNYIADKDMVQIAEALDISAADVYGTASFYSFLETEEKGKYVIRVCKSITCEMKGKHCVLKALEDTLKVKLGETTHDGLFSLEQANCLGLCDVGPAMLINEQPYTKLTPDSVHEIITEYRNKVK
ncbi:MAG: NAD(P)H-dependent oxidoreductase subunit E [Bacteroidales bacterium]|nr:NAD(P)H-dependent oxidoreductase subunit E [Bacteroidales bacterium]